MMVKLGVAKLIPSSTCKTVLFVVMETVPNNSCMNLSKICDKVYNSIFFVMMNDDDIHSELG